MTKLNQILAIEKGVRARTAKALTATYHLFQKPAGLIGLARTYQPVQDDGDLLPAESTPVQIHADQLIADAAAELVELFDIVATKEWANTDASADITVDGRVLVAAVPVTYLLFLEKQLIDLHAFASKIPMLDSTEVWIRDANQGVYATAPVQTVKTKKVPRVLVKAAATDKHPAQTEVYHEDQTVGHWTITKFSGALPKTDIDLIIHRIDVVQKAVKFAREEANMKDIDTMKIGAGILDFIFKP